MRPQPPPTQLGPGSHWRRRRRRLFPAWAPLLPRALRATEPTAAAAAVSPPHGAHWLIFLQNPPITLKAGLFIGVLEGSTTHLAETPISIGSQCQSVSAASSPFPLAGIAHTHWFTTPRVWNWLSICRCRSLRNAHLLIAPPSSWRSGAPPQKTP